jgi:hypothetical protein
MTGTEPVAFVRLTVAREAAIAERWRDALEAAGIEANLQIDDAAYALPGRSPLVGIGVSPMTFVYPISVPLSDRDRAAAVLIDHGWDGAVEGALREAPASTGSTLKAALLALAAAALIFAWRFSAS